MSAHSSESGEPNLTPVLDMVFQLITFFMLVINFKSASFDLSLKLPVVGSARPLESRGAAEALVLNVDSTGRVTAYGQEQDVERFIAVEAANRRALLQAGGTPLAAGEPLPGSVIIRADRATPFTLVNHVLKTCQAHGFMSFSLMAMTKPEGGTP